MVQPRPIKEVMFSDSHAYNFEVSERQSGIEGKYAGDTAVVSQIFPGLTESHVEFLINAVSKLQLVNGESQLLSILEEVESVLGLKGCALGIDDKDMDDKPMLAATSRVMKMPTFDHVSSTSDGVLSLKAAGENQTVFFERQKGGFYCWFSVMADLQNISQPQKQMLKYMLPSLYASIARVHSIAKQLSECGITSREQEVMQWIIEGKDNWSISKILGVSERTVKFHNCNIYRKLCVSTKAEVICWYYRLLGSFSAHENLRIPTASAL